MFVFVALGTRSMSVRHGAARRSYAESNGRVPSGATRPRVHPGAPWSVQYNNNTLLDTLKKYTNYRDV